MDSNEGKCGPICVALRVPSFPTNEQNSQAHKFREGFSTNLHMTDRRFLRALVARDDAHGVDSNTLALRGRRHRDAGRL